MRCIYFLMLFLILESNVTMAAEFDKWADPLSWLPVATIEGKEVTLRMYKLSDTVTRIDSAKSVKPGEGCSASYYYIQDDKEVSHGPSYTWKPGGDIIQKAYNFNGQLKYSYRYYSTGELLESEILDKDIDSTITTLFKKDGSIVGKHISANKPLRETTDADDTYYWNGLLVTGEDYFKRSKTFKRPDSK